MTAALGRRGSRLLTAAVAASCIVALDVVGRGALAAPPLSSTAALASWAQQRDPVSIGFALARLAALAVAYHLVLTTLLMACGRALRSPRLIGIAEAATLPPLRGTVRRLVGLGLSAGLVLSHPLPPALGRPQASLSLVTSGIARDPDGRVVLERVAPDPTARPVLRVAEDHVTHPVGDRADLEVVRRSPPTDPQAVVERIDLPGTAGTSATLERADGSAGAKQRATLERIDEIDEAATDPVSADAGASAAGRHVVRPGDHLWSIASEHLARSLGRVPTDSEVASHWRTVVEVNPQLVDPDVLFPGDEVELPAAPTPMD